MTYRRHRPGSDSTDEPHGSSVDLDSSMKRALHRESMEALRHQLDVERDARASMQRSDYFFTVGAIAFFGGLGYAVGAFDPTKVFKRKRR